MDNRIQLHASYMEAERKEPLIPTKVGAGFSLRKPTLKEKENFPGKKEAGEGGIHLGEAPPASTFVGGASFCSSPHLSTEFPLCSKLGVTFRGHSGSKTCTPPGPWDFCRLDGHRPTARTAVSGLREKMPPGGRACRLRRDGIGVGAVWNPGLRRNRGLNEAPRGEWGQSQEGVGEVLCGESPGPFWGRRKERPAWLGRSTGGGGDREKTGETAVGKATEGPDGHSKDLGFCPKCRGKSWKCSVHRNAQTWALQSPPGPFTEGLR